MLKVTSENIKNMFDNKELKRSIFEAERNILISTFEKSQPKLVKSYKDEIQKKFNVKKRVFLNGAKVQLFSSKPEQFPAMEIRNGIPWFLSHVKGSNYKGKNRLILFGKRLGFKSQKDLLRSLKNSNDTFFKKVNNEDILFLNINKKNKRDQKIKSLISSNNKKKRFIDDINDSNNTAIPIGIMLKKQTLKRRFDYSYFEKTQVNKIINDELKNQKNIYLNIYKNGSKR